MSQPLLPQNFWFRLCVPCQRLGAWPGNSAPGGWTLADSYRLPSLAPADGRAAWAAVKVGWEAEGLAVLIEADGGLGIIRPDDAEEHRPGATLWIDTRDTRDLSRATRFCHRFDATLARGPGRAGEVTVSFRQKAIARAIADAPLCRPDALAAHAKIGKEGWRLGLLLPAAALQGFDPETNRRLGFAFEVRRRDGEPEYLAAGRGFPLGENPSLWSTLELRGNDQA